MKFCLNTKTIDSCSLEEKVSAISGASYDGIELWLKDLVGREVSECKRIISDSGLSIPTCIKIAGWFEGDGSQMELSSNDRTKIMDECKRRIELGAEVGAEYIIAIPARDDRGYYADMKEGAEYFNQLLEFGKSVGCEPTIEFMGQTSQIKTIDSCLNFLSLVDGGKMVVDAYHIWRGGDSFSSMKKLSLDDISILHISDRNPSIDRLSHKDSDRVMPGDGDIDLKNFISEAKNLGFKGYISIGVYNPQNWDRDPNEVSNEAIKKLVQILDE
jgi:sugar phosphate isomerase/epimerase